MGNGLRVSIQGASTTGAIAAGATGQALGQGLGAGVNAIDVAQTIKPGSAPNPTREEVAGRAHSKPSSGAETKAGTDDKPVNSNERLR